MNVYFIFLIFFIVPVGGMEFPEQSKVPSLVELAARKCPASLVAPFDPYKEYKRAAKNLNSNAITHVIGNSLARHLAHSNAQTIQTILDESTSAPQFHTEYHNPANNLYENNHGIYNYSHTFFPPLGTNPEIKYRSVVLSADNRMCATGNLLSLALWNVASGNLIKQINYPQNGQDYHDLRPHAFSPDNQIITAWFREDLDDLQGGKPRCTTHMCAFDVGTGQLLYENLNGGRFNLGKKYLYMHQKEGIAVKNFLTNATHHIIPVEDQIRNKVGYGIDPHDDYLYDVSTKEPKSIKILGLPSAQLLGKLTCQDVVKRICLSATGSRLAALTGEAIEIWNPRDGQQIGLIPHSRDYELYLLQFADNDKVIYTEAKNIICGWDIANQKLLLAKEIPFAGPLKDGVLAVNIMKDEQAAALIWTRLRGQDIHSLYTKLGHELSLKKLSALLILEYEDHHLLPFSPEAIEIIENSKHKILKEIYEKRYNTVLFEVELESAAANEPRTWIK